MSQNLEFEIPESRNNVIRSNLKRAFAVNATIVSLGIFSFVFSVKFGISDNVIQLFSDGFLNTSDLENRISSLLNSRMHEILLFTGTLFWFFVYRSASYSEIELLSRLHSAARLPDKFEDFSKFSTVVILSAGLTICFALMAFFVNYFPLFCLFLYLASLQDLFGNRTIITQLRTLRKNNNEDVPLSDIKRDLIIRLRDVCYEYWTYKPQIERIMLFFIMNIFALLVYLYIAGISFANILAPEPKATIEAWMWFILRFKNPDLDGYNIWIVISYAISLAAIILNEYTIRKWRKERNQSLRKIFTDEIDLEQRLARGEIGTSNP